MQSIGVKIPACSSERAAEKPMKLYAAEAGTACKAALIAAASMAAKISGDTGTVCALVGDRRLETAVDRIFIRN